MIATQMYTFNYDRSGFSCWSVCIRGNFLTAEVQTGARGPGNSVVEVEMRILSLHLFAIGSIKPHNFAVCVIRFAFPTAIQFLAPFPDRFSSDSLFILITRAQFRPHRFASIPFPLVCPLYFFLPLPLYLLAS